MAKLSIKNTRMKNNNNIYTFRIFEWIVSQCYQGNEIRGEEEEQLPTPENYYTVSGTGN